jgi:MFS family permease
MLLTGNGMHALLLPLAGAAAGFSTAEIGLIGTGWAAGFIAGCLLAPVIVRRVGHVRAFASAAAGAAIIILLNGLVLVPFAWILLRVGSGFFLAGAFMILESWLNDRATNETRGTIFAVYLMISYLGITAGQLCVGLGDPRTTALFSVGGILFCLAVLPTALSTAVQPQPLTRVQLDLRRLFANSPVASLTVLLVGVINGAFGTLGAVWGIGIGLGTPAIALMMAITVVCGALTQLPAGRISDKIDRRYVIIAAALGAALAGLVIFILKPVSPNAVLPLIAVYGALAYPLYGLAVAHANDYADASEFVTVSGGLLLLYGVGTMIGPLAASAAMTALGPEALFIATAIGHAIIAGYAYYRTTRRAPIPESVRDAYRPVPSGRGLTPESAALDPRAEDATVLDREPLQVAK